MKRVLFLIALCFFLLVPKGFALDLGGSSGLLISSSIDRQVSRINYEIKKDKREIARVKASRDLSYNEKKKRIRKLEYEIYRKKRAIARIRV